MANHSTNFYNMQWSDFMITEKNVSFKKHYFSNYFL